MGRIPGYKKVETIANEDLLHFTKKASGNDRYEDVSITYENIWNQLKLGNRYLNIEDWAYDDNDEKIPESKLPDSISVNFGTEARQVASWAEGNNNDIIPTSKLPEDMKRSFGKNAGDIAEWAEYGNTSTLPADKIPFSQVTFGENDGDIEDWAEVGSTELIPSAKIESVNYNFGGLSNEVALWAEGDSEDIIPVSKLSPLEVNGKIAAKYNNQLVPSTIREDNIIFYALQERQNVKADNLFFTSGDTIEVGSQIVLPPGFQNFFQDNTIVVLEDNAGNIVEGSVKSFNLSDSPRTITLRYSIENWEDFDGSLDLPYKVGFSSSDAVHIDNDLIVEEDFHVKHVANFDGDEVNFGTSSLLWNEEEAYLLTFGSQANQVADWADGANTDKIPDSKLPALGVTFGTGSGEVASWAEGDSTTEIPSSRLPDGIGGREFGSGSGNIAEWAEGDNTDDIPASKIPDSVGKRAFGSGDGEIATWAEGDDTTTIPKSKIDGDYLENNTTDSIYNLVRKIDSSDSTPEIDTIYDLLTIRGRMKNSDGTLITYTEISQDVGDADSTSGSSSIAFKVKEDSDDQGSTTQYMVLSGTNERVTIRKPLSLTSYTGGDNKVLGINSSSQLNVLDLPTQRAFGGSSGNIATWAEGDSDEVLPGDKIPNIQFGDQVSFASTALRNSSTETAWQKGDRAVVSGSVYLYTGDNQDTAAATTDSDWTELNYSIAFGTSGGEIATWAEGNATGFIPLGRVGTANDTVITASVAEINNLDGFTGDTDDLNLTAGRGALVDAGGNGIDGTPTNNQVIGWDSTNSRLYWKNDETEGDGSGLVTLDTVQTITAQKRFSRDSTDGYIFAFQQLNTSTETLFNITGYSGTYQSSNRRGIIRLNQSGTDGRFLFYVTNSGSFQNPFEITPDYLRCGVPLRIGGNSSDNELDDYEEGSWTGNANITGEQYVKIGRVVNVWGNCTAASGTTSTGLPFTITDGNNQPGHNCTGSNSSITVIGGGRFQLTYRTTA